MIKQKAKWTSTVKGKRELDCRELMITPKDIISVMYYGWGKSLLQLHYTETGEIIWRIDNEK